MPVIADTAKQRAHALIDELPDDAQWRDIVLALAIIDDIEAGLSESEAGQGVDTATLRERFGVA